MKNEVTLNVVLYSYLDRPIFDIYLNKVDLGVASPYGGTGIISGVSIPVGVQKLTWRLDGPKGALGNGDTIVAKEKPVLNLEKIPSDARYLGVHIYPDATTEFTFSKYIPDTTPRGDTLLKAGKNGK